LIATTVRSRILVSPGD